LHVNLRLQRGLKQSCDLYQELSSSMLHVACTRGNRDDFLLFVVGSQTINSWLSTFLLAITCVSDVEMGHASPF
jgi:hypothetical protein